MERIMDFDVKMLITQVLVISVEVLGITQYLKHFIRLENGYSRYYALVALACTIICVFINTKYTPPGVTYIFNMVALVTAVVQLAYEAVVRGLQNMILRVMGGVTQETLNKGALNDQF